MRDATQCLTKLVPLAVTLFLICFYFLKESGEIGIGQLFRYLDILPEFELHNAGLHSKDAGGFWREYTLKCAELTCDIREDFRSGMWEIKPIVTVKSL